MNFKEKCQIARSKAKADVRNIQVDTVLGHKARYGGKFDEYFSSNSAEKKAINGEIGFIEYLNQNKVTL